MILSGIRVPGINGQEDQIVIAPLERLSALTSAWAPTFQGKPIDSVMADDVLSHWAVRMNCSELPPPDEETLMQAASAAKLRYTIT